ncbi:MAG: malate dehydrogenase, partial [Bacteroidetes bacterium]|nr:malate dehydrogenase [Bacteroidota bacterium]
MKITVVGAGNVGATVADNMVRRELAEEIVLLDIKEGFAEGKAMDMNQTATLNGFDSKVVGSTNDYSKTAGSAVAVITSGIPRKPGMTREELIGTNAKIVQMVTENLIK